MYRQVKRWSAGDLRTYNPFVISDSVPWKVELRRVADRLEKRKGQKRWTEQTSFIVERDVMVAAYAIRRLIEARKLSDDVTSTEVEVTRHDLSVGPPDLISFDRVWKHYDLNAGTAWALSLADFCNQIIHSFVWALGGYETGGLSGVFFSSDRARRNYLYFADADLILSLLRRMAYDDVVGSQMVREANGDWRVIALVGADARTARYEWLMTRGSRRAE